MAGGTPSIAVDAALAGRRTIRHFAIRPVEPALVEEIIAAACLAPAPHHSRPWRFVILSDASRARLRRAMHRRWRQDLQSDGLEEERIRRLLARSRARLAAPPVLILAGLLRDPQRPWPDQRRQRAEELMFVQSMGAALENLMLAAHARGLGTCWISAPLFCPESVSQALDLPLNFQPQALIALGYPKEGLRLPPRPPLAVGDYVMER